MYIFVRCSLVGHATSMHTTHASDTVILTGRCSSLRAVSIRSGAIVLELGREQGKLCMSPPLTFLFSSGRCVLKFILRTPSANHGNKFIRKFHRRTW